MGFKIEFDGRVAEVIHYDINDYWVVRVYEDGIIRVYKDGEFSQAIDIKKE